MAKKSHDIRGVIFDLDDTLAKVKVDWESMRVRIRNLYSQYGVNLEFRPVLQHIDEATRVLREGLGESKAFEVRSRALKIIEETAFEGARSAVPIKGAQEVLKLTHELGLKVGILSRNTRKAVLTTVQQCNFSRFVDVVMAREDCVKYKPDPLPVEEMAKKLEVNAHHLLVIGDHPYDIFSGKAAGAITIGVLVGTPSRADLTSAGADFIVSTLGELKTLLSNLIKK